MSKIITDRKQLPEAPFYVLADDEFMSGWGAAEGTVNTVILPCANADEKLIVIANVRARDEMKHIRVVGGKPHLEEHIVYSLLTPTTASAWYRPNGDKS